MQLSQVEIVFYPSVQEPGMGWTWYPFHDILCSPLPLWLVCFSDPPFPSPLVLPCTELPVLPFLIFNGDSLCFTISITLWLLLSNHLGLDPISSHTHMALD